MIVAAQQTCTSMFYRMCMTKSTAYGGRHAQHSTAWQLTAHCSMAQPSIARCITVTAAVQQGMSKHGTSTEHAIIQQSMAQHSPAGCSTTQHSSAGYSTAQPSRVQHSKRCSTWDLHPSNKGNISDQHCHNANSRNAHFVRLL